MRAARRILLFLTVVFVFLSCTGESSDLPPSMDIIAEEYEFTAPDTVRSGWTTLRLHNQGSKSHLFVLIRLPEGVTFEGAEGLFAAYDSVMTLYSGGVRDTSRLATVYNALKPDWYPDDVVFPGGVSLTAPGRTAETAVHLEPGRHVFECYVVTEDGQYHFLEGMTHELVVVPEGTEAGPPDADQQLRVADLKVDGVGPVSAGEHTFAVRFVKDPQTRQVQHLHLARLEEDTDADQLADWWRSDPIMPAPVDFLGGAQHLPAGHTAYVTVELRPGRYAWVLGNPPEQGEVEPFRVN